MGTLTKQIYRYTHPRDMRHNENLWPFVKIKRDKFDAITQLFYKHEAVPLVDLSALKNNYDGSVLLTATGPSIKQIDFTSMSNIPSAGVNGAWYLNNHIDFKFYIIVDMLFIDNKPDVLEKIISKSDLILFTTMHGIIKLINKFSLNKFACKISIIEDKCYQVYRKKINNKDLKKYFSAEDNVFFEKNIDNVAFNYDIRSGVFDAGTVAYWSLQILFFLGFKKIYIAGLDMTNFSSPRFYETPDNMLPSFLDGKLHDLIIPAFSLARNALDKKNVEVINLSPESAIPSNIFFKMDYRDAFK